jgi:hypothetical protein
MMGIKCGKGHIHESVADVRECYGVEAVGFAQARPAYRPNKYPGECQKCGGLLKAEEGRVDKTDAGWQTSHLDGKCPAKPEKVTVDTTTDRYSKIPSGHYATKSLTGNNDFDFWRVDRPLEGKYKGYIFVKRIVGGKPDQNVQRNTKFAALSAILEEGIEPTALRYGQELGRCSRCNRTLTDEVSRQYGKGPECRSK